MNPRLIIDIKKLTHNAAFLADFCRGRGVSLAVVTKVFCADSVMVDALSYLPIDFFADSRLENIEAYPEGISQRTMLLRLPAPRMASEIVAKCDISLNSELATIELLAKAAEGLNKTHGIILMIDLGDLREGIYHTDAQKIMDTCRYILSQKSLKLEGLGTNLTCYGSVLPTSENLGRLCEIADIVQQELGVKLPIISGGNSSSLKLLAEGKMPVAINNLRLGESVVCGLETAYGEPFPGLVQDVVVLEADIIEIAKKPSLPEGETNINAFGEKMEYADHGHHTRAILAIGRQDTNHEGLRPLNPGVSIVGASSDHLIVDISDASTLAVGDSLRFGLSYGAILAGFTSKYVDREYVN
ncbi:MAG: alanine/ornithine racemase family PLP-dependent enzyme [Defluviitaleaceae bacterium]|nr:alanine/ornithine racemase family PLP-dependent enzyme [Defluviitaleaceae bacterium]